MRVVNRIVEGLLELNLVPIKHVVIGYSEDNDLDDLRGKKLSAKEFDRVIGLATLRAPAGGAYNKTDVTFTWNDGEAYRDRIDVTGNWPRGLDDYFKQVVNYYRSGRAKELAKALGTKDKTIDGQMFFATRQLR